MCVVVREAGSDSEDSAAPAMAASACAMIDDGRGSGADCRLSSFDGNPEAIVKMPKGINQGCMGVFGVVMGNRGRW